MRETGKTAFCCKIYLLADVEFHKFYKLSKPFEERKYFLSHLNKHSKIEYTLNFIIIVLDDLDYYSTLYTQ